MLDVDGANSILTFIGTFVGLAIAVFGSSWAMLSMAIGSKYQTKVDSKKDIDDLKKDFDKFTNDIFLMSEDIHKMKQESAVAQSENKGALRALTIQVEETRKLTESVLHGVNNMRSIPIDKIVEMLIENKNQK